MSGVALTGAERRSVGALAAIYSSRMLGLFLLLPVLALYASELPGTTPALIGLAMGAYGLTQALLQIPFGMWSDKYGRKPVITLGLGIFFLGSVYGVFADTAWELILARSLQGAGAVSASVTALIADHTRDEVRTRAMAFIGMAIGGSFVTSLIAAPLLQSSIGVPGIFALIAGMCVVGVVILFTLVPPDIDTQATVAISRAKFWAAATHPRARIQYVAVFVLHFVLTAVFLVVPLVLSNDLNWPAETHWKVYLGVFLASLVGTVPMILRSERGGAQFLLAAIVLAAGSQGLLAIGIHHQLVLFAGFTLFFAAFNFLEARVPALLTVAVSPQERGTALGVFATAQFLGAFFGGWIGGLVLARLGEAAVFWTAAMACVGWALFAVLDRNESARSRP